MAEQAPHILGMTVAEHADRPGEFTQTVYFTSEDEARRVEREQPAESDPDFAELSSLMTDRAQLQLPEQVTVAVAELAGAAREACRPGRPPPQLRRPDPPRDQAASGDGVDDPNW